MHPADRDRLLDRALRELPAPRAPHTLLPRVMDAVAASGRAPWYRRSWRTWPPPWRVAAAAAGASAVVAALTMPVPGAVAFATIPQAAFDTVSPAAAEVGAIAADAVTVWRVVLRPAAIVTLPVALLMWAACVSLTLALGHLALRRNVTP
jgi:hypothetical protein